MTQQHSNHSPYKAQQEKRYKAEAFKLFGVPETAEMRYHPRSRLGDKPAPGVVAAWQPMVPAAFFLPTASTSTKADVARVLALSYDADICDYYATPAHWGSTREEKKKYLYAAPEAEILEWIGQSGYVEELKHTLAELGHPTPDTVLYTGHGVLLLTRLPENMGAKDDILWGYETLCLAWREECLRLIAAGYEWVIDPSAKDLGTRLIPLPGHRHRNSEKVVRLLSQTDPSQGLEKFFSRLIAQTPAAAPRSPKARKQEPKAGATFNPGAKGASYQRKEWLPEYGEMPAEGVETTCPTCPSDRTRGAMRYAGSSSLVCHRCSTRWLPPKKRDWSLPSDLFVHKEEVKIELDERGYAKFDRPLHDFSVLKMRTGSGKTTAMKKIIAESAGRALVVVPTTALAANCSEVLSLPHAAAGSKIDLSQGSCVCCLARFAETTKRMTNEQIAECTIILDESEAQLRQLSSILATSPETVEALVRGVALGARVVLSDAHAGLQTRELIRCADEWRAEAKLEKRSFTWYVTEGHKFKLQYVMDATRGSQTISSHDVHLNIISEQLEQGQRPIAWVYAKSSADAFGATLRARHPGKKIIVVTSPDTEDARIDLDAKALQTADCLIYNNAMSSGVSLDAGHYDQVHLLAANAPEIDADMLEQALHRDRVAAHGTILVSGVLRECPKDYDDQCDPEWQLQRAVDEFLAEEKIAKKSCVSLLSTWHFSRVAKWMGRLQACGRAQAARSGRGWGLTVLLDRHGGTLLDTEYDSSTKQVAKETRAAKKAITATKATRTLVATPVTDERAKEIIEGDLPANEEELASYHKQRVVETVGELCQFPAEVVSRLAERQVKGKLSQEVHLLAMGAAFLAGPREREQATRWHKLRVHRTDGDVSKSTIICARHGLRDAQDLASLIGIVLHSTQNSDDAFVLGGPAQKRHCSLLRRAGIAIRCTRRSASSARVYSVRREDVLLALLIANKRFERITAEDKPISG